MLKIRRPLGRLIFNMGIAIPGKTVFLIETAPRFDVDDFTPSVHRKNQLNNLSLQALAEVLFPQTSLPYHMIGCTRLR